MKSPHLVAETCWLGLTSSPSSFFPGSLMWLLSKDAHALLPRALTHVPAFIWPTLPLTDTLLQFLLSLHELLKEWVGVTRGEPAGQVGEVSLQKGSREKLSYP